MAVSWYYVHDGTRKGPVSRDDLQLALSRGEIDRRSQVWCQGLSQWQALDTVEELQSLLERLPPPLPHEPPPLPHEPPPASAPPALQPPASAPPPPALPASVPPAVAGSPTAAAADRPARAKAVETGRRRKHMAAAVVLLAFAAVAAYYILRPRPPIAGQAMGQVRIDANPWGRIEWIRGASGSTIDLPEARSTPFLIALPAGNYQARVAYPHGQTSERCDLRVRSDQLTTCWLDLAPVDANSYFQKIGW